MSDEHMPGPGPLSLELAVTAEILASYRAGQNAAQLRVWLPSDVRLSYILDSVQREAPDMTVYVCMNLRTDRELPDWIEELNASAATKIRNARRPLLVLGSAEQSGEGGQPEGGLQFGQGLPDKAAVAAQWLRSARDYATKNLGIGSQFADGTLALVESVIEAWEPHRVDGGTIILSSVAADKFFNDLLGSKSIAKEAGKKLHQLELLQDQRINDLLVSNAGDIAIHKFYALLQDNSGLLRQIKHPNTKKEQTAVENLFASDEVEAKMLQAWLEDWDRSHLEGVDLERVRNLMKVDSIKVSGSLNLTMTELLRVPLQPSASETDELFWLPDEDGSYRERDNVISAFAGELDAAWSDPGGRDPAVIEVDLWERGEGQPVQVRRELTLDSLSDSMACQKARFDWLDTNGTGGIYLGIKRLAGQEDPLKTSAEELRGVVELADASPAVIDALNGYLQIRAIIVGTPDQGVLIGSRLFLWQQSDENLLAMLLVSREMRADAARWHEAWLGLLSTASEDAKVLRMPDIARAISELECEHVESLSGDEDQIRFAPWHPVRLGGLANLAAHGFSDEALAKSAIVSPDSANEVFAARQFALPIVSAFNSGRGGYWFVDNGGKAGVYSYARKKGGSVAPAATGGNYLSQMVRAFQAAHPWSGETGISVLVVNPPSGTAMSQFYKSLTRAYGDHVQLTLISGPHADFPEINEEGMRVSARKTKNLPDWLDANRPRGQIALVFSPVEVDVVGQENPAAVLSLGVGFGPNGLNDLQTQITVNPTEGRSESLYMTKLLGSQQPPVLQHWRNPTGDEVVIANTLLKTFEWVGFGVGGYASADFGSGGARDPIKLALLPIDSYHLQISTDFHVALIERLANPVLEVVQSRAEPSEVRQAIMSAVAASPVDLLTGFLKRFGPEEAFGLVLASVAADTSISERGESEDLIATLSLDRAMFTTGWVSMRQQRADLLKIVVPGGLTDRPIELVVVESKATHATYLDPDRTKAPFAEAVEQVFSTARDLSKLLGQDADNHSWFFKLRRKALSRGIFRAVASHPRMARPGPSEKRIMERLTSAFKEESSGIVLKGMVVASFIDAMRPFVCVSREENDVDLTMELTLLSLTRWDMQALLEGGAVMSGTPGHKTHNSTVVAPLKKGEQGIGADESPDSAAATIGTVPLDATIDLAPTGESGSTFSEPAVEPEVFLIAQSEELGKKAFNAARLYSKDLVEPKSVTVVSGPTFHLVSLKMMAGGNLQELQRREIDIARELGVSFVTIENDDTQGRIRLLIPRQDRQYPARTRSADPLSDSISNDHYLGIKVGVDLYNREHTSYISQWVHTLVAGTTGSGKTTFLRSIVSSLGDIGPHGVSYIIVDGKGGNDFIDANASGFDIEVAAALGSDGPAYRANPEALGPKHAVSVVAWLAEVEIPRRRAVANEKARELGTRWDARKAYIEDIREGRVPLLKPLVVIVDEFAQITLAKDENSKRFQEAVKEIAQLSRAYLVHLILATQRPDAQVVPPLIKANAPSRIALKLPALGDSITILAEKGAEALAGKGDLILKPIEGESIRLQGFSD